MALYNKWSVEDEGKLKEIYYSTEFEELVKIFNRSKPAIKIKASLLGLKKFDPNCWSDEENILLSDRYPLADLEEFKKLFPNRTWEAIKIQSSKLGLKRLNLPNYKKSDLSILLEETSETYYWLGLLMADGHFSKSRITLALAKKDKDYLIRFSKYIKYSGDIRDNKHGAYCLAAMDATVVPKIKSKFNISNRKTYEPCLIDFKDDFFISFLIGFIDGDGSINKQSNRDDCLIRIKCHSSWLANFKLIVNKLESILGISIPAPYIEKKGYAILNISNSIIVNFLKKKAISLNLPYLNRKWDLINENHENRLVKSRFYEKEIIKRISLENKKGDIAKSLGVSNSTVSNIIKRINYASK